MDKNTWIGFLLIAAIIVGFTMLNRPSKEQLAERQRIQDSINIARLAEAEAMRLEEELKLQTDSTSAQTEAVATEESKPEEQWTTLSNEKVRLTISSYGGAIQRAELTEYRASGDSIQDLLL